jgi:alpha-1,6-mannosyltransferase
MRIVQVANFYTPTSGGLRVAVEETGRRYQQAGHERILIVPGRTDSVERTPSGLRFVVRSLRLPGLGDYRILLNRRRIRRLLTEQRPDVLEVSDKASIRWLARWSGRRNVPLVLFSHERLDAVLRPRVPRWFPLAAATDAVNRRLSRLADQIIVASDFSAAEFERVGAANLRRVRLGVDLETFRPATDPATGQADAAPTGAAADPTVRLITVSRLSREKRPERAIETLRVLRQWGVPATLLIVGDGPQRQRLVQRADGLPVSFLPHVSDRRALARLIAGADLALFPSPAETFGLATLEALACGPGTPGVAGVRCGQRRYAGRHGTGRPADPRDIRRAAACRGARGRRAVPLERDRRPTAQRVRGDGCPTRRVGEFARVNTPSAMNATATGEPHSTPASRRGPASNSRVPAIQLATTSVITIAVMAAGSDPPAKASCVSSRPNNVDAPRPSSGQWNRATSTPRWVMSSPTRTRKTAVRQKQMPAAVATAPVRYCRPYRPIGAEARSSNRMRAPPADATSHTSDWRSVVCATDPRTSNRMTRPTQTDALPNQSRRSGARPAGMVLSGRAKTSWVTTTACTTTIEPRCSAAACAANPATLATQPSSHHGSRTSRPSRTRARGHPMPVAREGGVIRCA